MRHFMIILAVFAGLAATARAQSEVLVPAQAADVLADLITNTVARADARVEAMHRFLRENGKDEAFYAAKRPPAEKPISFSEIFKGAMMYVKNGGAQYADPALASMNNEQLTNELTELQVYNIQQFQHLVQQKQSADAMLAFMKSSGDLEKYQAWAKTNAPAELPAPTTPEQVAARMDAMVQSAKATAWTKAQARGMNEADFEAAWKDRVTKYRETIAKKVDGSKELAKSLSSPPVATAAPATPLPPATPINGATPIIVNQGTAVRAAPLPGPVQSQYTPSNTAATFQQRNDELWNRFDDD